MQNNILNIYIKLVKPLRLPEVVLMSGFFIVGYIFALHSVKEINGQTAEIYLSILLYILSVYTLNSFCDYRIDRNNPRLQHLSTIGRSAYGYMTVIALGLSITLAYAVNGIVCILTAASFCLWILYYVKPFRLKSRVIGGTLIHLIAGVLHFHIGYCALKLVSIRSVAIGLFFALILAMGHLNHEIIDYESDKLTSIKNSAVTWGTNKIARASNAVFVLSIIYWVAIFLSGLLNLVEFASFFSVSCALPVYSLLSSSTQRNPFAYQRYYRIAFVIGGCLLILTRVFT